MCTRRATGGNTDLFSDVGALTLYNSIKDQVSGQASLAQIDAVRTTVAQAMAGLSDPDPFSAKNLEFGLLAFALKHVREVAAENTRVDNLPSGGSADTNARSVASSAMAATALDYQLAVIQAGHGTATLYTDLVAQQTIKVNGSGPNGDAIERVSFGNSDGNTLSGLGANDRLYGGSGNDTLLGGQGNDTYVFSGKFGNDVIADDVDGQGSIQIDTVALTGGKKVAPNIWESADKMTVYTLMTHERRARTFGTGLMAQAQGAL